MTKYARRITRKGYRLNEIGEILLLRKYRGLNAPLFKSQNDIADTMASLDLAFKDKKDAFLLQINKGLRDPSAPYYRKIPQEIQDIVRSALEKRLSDKPDILTRVLEAFDTAVRVVADALLETKYPQNAEAIWNRSDTLPDEFRALAKEVLKKSGYKAKQIEYIQTPQGNLAWLSFFSENKKIATAGRKVLLDQGYSNRRLQALPDKPEVKLAIYTLLPRDLV